MDIVWLGHSCFRLRSDDIVVVTDPFPSSIGLSMGQLEARLVTVSHSHLNHSHLEGVGGSPTTITGPGEYEVSGVYVRGVVTPRGRGDPPDKRNTAYLIDMDGITLLHLGDLNALVTPGQVEELKPVDLLFVPAGGVCTLGATQLAEVIKSLSPRVVVPMHYKVPGLNVALQPLDALKKELGFEEGQPLGRLALARSNLPESLQFVVMEPSGAR